jgi:hypothetical protein
MFRKGLGLVALLVACGGSEFSPDTQAGSSSGGAGGTSGAGSTTGTAGDGRGGASLVAAGGGAGSSGAGGTSGVGGTGGAAVDGGSQDAGVNCPALAFEVGQKLQAAQACNPNDPVVECQDIVDGLCCHVPVASKDSVQTRAYLGALTKYRDNCSFGCPATVCPMGAPACKLGPDGNNYFCQRLPVP